MRFTPIFFGNKLRIINPNACIGIVTLWSEKEFIIRKLKNAGADLSPETSPVAVIGNLHGQGFRYLLRNLLYNPQISALLVLGNDRIGSYRYLSNFFSYGTEPAESSATYKCASGNTDVKTVRVIGTDYIMDSLVSREMFFRIPEIVRIEGVEKPDAGAAAQAAAFLKTYMPPQEPRERIRVEVPEVVMETYPNNPRIHTIAEDAPSDAWRSLVHRVFRFGKKILVKKGERIELQNVKVVIEHPRFEDKSVIEDCGFDAESFAAYQKEILSSELSPDKIYSYGHRIRSYFGMDCLETAAANLKQGTDDRNCYISTWDNASDIEGKHRPCLVSLFFRKIENILYLTSTFRTHNASNAWLENVYGLMAIQNYVCKKTEAKPGALTVISHSVSLDPQYLEKAKVVHDQVAGTNIIRQDPNGYFRITTDGSEIVVQHCYGADTIGEYRGRKPVKIQHILYRDCAISDIGHALYIGRQLEKAYHCIQEGIPYKQD
jgi:thymidylate synthase